MFQLLSIFVPGRDESKAPRAACAKRYATTVQVELECYLVLKVERLGALWASAVNRDDATGQHGLASQSVPLPVP